MVAETINKPIETTSSEGRGRKATKVNLGSTANIRVVQELIGILAKDRRFSELAKL